MTHDQRPRNAWKHGGYSNLGVLPGESAHEFKRLHQSLIVEWEPSGPTECETVLSLAKCMWRQSRLTIYAQITEACREPARHMLHDAIVAFRAARAAHGPPRPTPPEWEKPATELSANRNQEQQQLATISEQVTREKLIEEIDLAGRLDARIDRLLKRLFQLKAAKQMLGLGSRSQDGSSGARKLPSPGASRANGGDRVAAD